MAEIPSLSLSEDHIQDVFGKESAQEKGSGRKSGEVRVQRYIPLASVVSSNVEYKGLGP
jgi:hypothetical protein